MGREGLQLVVDVVKIFAHSGYTKSIGERYSRKRTNNFFLAFSFLRFFINSVGFVTLIRMSEMTNMLVLNSILYEGRCGKCIVGWGEKRNSVQIKVVASGIVPYHQGSNW